MAYFRETNGYHDDTTLLLTSLLQHLSSPPIDEVDHFHWEELIYTKEILEKALHKKSLVADFEFIDSMDWGLLALTEDSF